MFRHVSDEAFDPDRLYRPRRRVGDRACGELEDKANGSPQAVDCAAILASAIDSTEELNRFGNEILGVSPDALHALGARYWPADGHLDPCWLLPERSHTGEVIGIVRRYLDGSKRQWPGTMRGIIYPDGWSDEVAGCVLLVEGHSDVAACMTMNLTAVGRPSNLGGADLLTELLRDIASPPQAVPVVVVGENDRKPSGAWPGLHGAQETAQAIADGLGVPVWVAMPPPEAKDTRAWLLANRERTPGGPKMAGLRYLGELVKSACVALPAGGIVKSAYGSGSYSIAHVYAVLKFSIPALFFREEYRSVGALHNQWSTDSHLGNGVEDDASGDDSSFGPSAASVLSLGRTRALCPKHRVPILARADDIHHGAAIRADCRRWACPSCGPRRRSLWLVHLACRLADWPGPLHTLTVPSDRIDDFAAATRLWNKQYPDDRQEWAAARRNDGTALIITTRAADPSSPFSPSALISPPQASEQLAHSLLRLDLSLRQPVTTSRAWALPQREPSRQEYTRVGQAPTGRYEQTVIDVEGLADESVQTVTSDGKTAVFFSFSEEWDEQRVKDVYPLLGHGIVPEDLPGEGGVKNEEELPP